MELTASADTEGDGVSQKTRRIDVTSLRSQEWRHFPAGNAKMSSAAVEENRKAQQHINKLKHPFSTASHEPETRKHTVRE
jgi:hypothetical protein